MGPHLDYVCTLNGSGFCINFVVRILYINSRKPSNLGVYELGTMNLEKADLLYFVTVVCSSNPDIDCDIVLLY